MTRRFLTAPFALLITASMLVGGRAEEPLALTDPWPGETPLGETQLIDQNAIEQAETAWTLEDAVSRINQLEAAVFAPSRPSLPVPCGSGEYRDGCDLSGQTRSPVASFQATHGVVYDGGWVLRPYDHAKTPLELKFELHNQFRYTGFQQDAGPSFDAAGNPRELSDRNDFDINRGRIVFSGYAFDRALGFYTNIDYSTVASSSIQPLLAWVSYDFDERLKLSFGLGKVPGTWEWQQTSRYTLGADRSLATTFFRPSISAGIWASGTLANDMHYTAFVGDGFNTLSLRADDLDTRLVYSALCWYEPLGDFGVGFSDQECHQQVVTRVGHGLTYTRNESAPDLNPGAEGTVIRLSDGTRVVEPGALLPGQRVNQFDIWLYTVHGGWKHRGFSFSGEYYFRWLENLRGTLGGEFESIFDQGYFVQSAGFAIPKTLEFFVRGSQVFGDHGKGSEVSLGSNVYLYQRRGARLTFEITEVVDSPAEQSRTGYVAGGDGTLLRAQLWTFF